MEDVSGIWSRLSSKVHHLVCLLILLALTYTHSIFQLHLLHWDLEQAEQQSPPLGHDGENETVTEYATCVRGEPSQDANGPPKVDSKVEILHEKVTKQIIKEGHGQIPSKYSTCFLHYRAWTESTGHKFEDTWDEQRPLEMTLGKEKKEMTGLAIGVSSMKFGECALLHVGWELGYGKEWRFSFPNVPPVADISYEVVLIGFDETKGKARSDMTVEERIGAADRRKMDGNALFREEKKLEAMQQL